MLITFFIYCGLIIIISSSSSSSSSTLHFLSAVPHFVLVSYYVKVIVNKGSVVKKVSI